MSGKKTISNTTPAIGAIKIQQSTYGVVIPIVWGRTRVTGNLIWYGDFKAVPHTEVTQQGGKGGGGAPQQTTTTYTYQASVAMALCEGPVLGVRTAWRGKKIFEGSTFSGSTRRLTETLTVPSSGARTVSIANKNGWVPISVERRVSAEFADDFKYNRTGSWTTLVPGSDFTAAAGVYSFGSSGQVQPGDTVRVTYTFVSSVPSYSCLAQIGLDLFNGTPGQQPWTYLTSRHSDQALGYSGIAYVAGANYSLDDGASVENHAFEIETSFMTSASVPDADPSLIAADALTNPYYGAQFGIDKLGPMSDYSAACLAQGIVLSPALTEQMTAASFLEQLSAMTNVGLVWSGGLLKFVPYTDTQVSGNGTTFSPITTPLYDLTDDDFQPNDDQGPVKVTRGAVSDSYNSVKLEYFDRSNDYNIAIMEQADQADIQENGPRPMPVVTAHWITEAYVAKIVATLILQRSLFIRNTYEFKLGWTKIALEPMDLVTLTDPNLGMDKAPVRILSVEESDDGYLSVVAEDFPKGSASATLYPTGSGGGFTPNFNETPGAPMAPVIFEGPAALATSNGGLEVWLATGSLSETYGGCEVWVSLTGSDYRRAATLNGKSRFGVTTTSLPAADAGSMTVDSLGVQLSSGGQLLAATMTDMNALVTLCYVDGEFFSYETSQLTGASAYTIGGHMVRGAYLSKSGAGHLSGQAFVRCDDAVAKVQLTPDYIGRTVRIKLLPFNRYGGAVGSLADATEYTYTVTGAQANQAPIAPRNLGVEGPFTATTAKFRWDRIGNAASYNVQIWAGSPAAKVREVNVGDSLRYDYSASDAKSDGGPWRTLIVKVQGIHANGAAGPFSTFTATNPQVGALTGVAAAPGPRTVQFACDRPSDADYSGILVWLSATQGFTPDASTLVFDGPDTNVTINRLKGGAQLALGATYYVRAAAYDSFDRNGLTISAELPVVIENTTGVQTAIVQLYKWSTAVPAKPTGSSTFTWATGANAGYASAPVDGWLVAPGSNPGTPGASLWIATVQIVAPTGSTTTTVDYTNSTVNAWSQNGTNGSSGVNNGAATVYRWAATVPQGPAGNASYKWSDGSFGAAPLSPDGSVWGLTAGAPPSVGMTLWAAKVTVVDSAAATTTPFNWTAAAVMAVGYAASDGKAGASYVTAYCASATPNTTTAPSTTTGKTSVPAANSGGLVGAWTSTVPVLGVNQYLYQSDGIYDPTTDKTIWSIPYWSSLKVGSLSAISANLGQITAGSLNINNGVAVIDAAGNAVFKSVRIEDGNGNVVFQSGGKVAAAAMPDGTLNAELLPIVYQAQVSTFSPWKTWDFNGTLDGWGTTGIATPTLNATSVTIASNGGDPIFRSPNNLNFSGRKYDKVRARVRRLGGSGWDGNLYFDQPGGSGEGTLGAGYVGNYLTTLNQWVTIEWDMSGVPGWVNYTIEHFRLDFGTTAQDVFEVDWVAVGRYGTGSDELAATAVVTANNNLLDLSWWKRGNNPAAYVNDTNGEALTLIATGMDAPLGSILGPRGVDDVVAYTKEQNLVVSSDPQTNGTTQNGGGWNGNFIQLDPTKTYRFAIPIRRVSGSGSSYWGTQNVCTLNTTTPQDNPYFTATTGLLTDRWYIFVGYIYPYGSTGHTNEGSGVIDCKTGKWFTGSGFFNANYNHSASGSVNHRAYQYYSTTGAEQIFGRPMINLVDGTEPSLDQFLEVNAKVNSAITVNADGSLNNAGTGKATLPGLGQNVFRVMAGGLLYQYRANSGVFKNGERIYYAGRSYTVAMIRRSDGVVVQGVDFDVYGSGAATGGRDAAAMAAMLNSYGPDHIAIIWSFDEPKTNRLNGGLDAAMYRCGASRAVYGSGNFAAHSAYILIGIPGCGEGNGAEAYQGSISDDPNAWCDMTMTLVNGAFTVSPGYTPRSLIDYGYVGDLNATKGATLGVDVGGQITAANASTFIASAAIDLALIKTASITSLSALTATIGTLRARASGERLELKTEGLQVFDISNIDRVTIGQTS